MKKKKIGLACMSKKRRREIARMGALRLHQLGKAGKFTSATARAAVKKRYGTA